MNRRLIDLIEKRVEKSPDRPALLHSVGGKWESLTWLEFDEITNHIAHGLMAMGLEPGQSVAILSRSRLEWVLADIGIIKAGCCSVPIHANSLPEQIEHILTDSNSRAIFFESEKDSSNVRCKACGEKVQNLIVMRGPAKSDDETSWQDLIAMGKAHKAEFPGSISSRQKKLKASSLATLVYTSGTTGMPKGVMLTQANIVFQSEALAAVMESVIGPDDIHLMCLPLSHILARSIVFAGITTGYANAFCTSLEAIDREMREIRPTFITVVPLILEQFHSSIRDEMNSRNPITRLVLKWSRGVEGKVAKNKMEHIPLPPSLAVTDVINKRFILGPGISERFGGRLKFFISGGAPLARSIAEFFESIGILVLEGYGLTENVGAANVNRPDRYRFGTVGPPVVGVEELIADDGEILIRGPNVMAGYFNQPEATAEVLDENGWLHTGDIGHFEDGGFLKVTGRKKDIIVTSGGKNVSPQNIERRLRASKYIQQAMVVGDNRRYLTALVSLDHENLQKFAEDEGLALDKIEELASHPRIRELVQREIDSCNRRLASFETIRRFTILPTPLSLDAGELTPTNKIRRQQVEVRYADLIETMYEMFAEKHDEAWAGDS